MKFIKLEKIQEEVDSDNRFMIDLKILSKEEFIKKYDVSSEEYNHLLEADNVE